jgi:hypothetical protein
VFGDRLVGCCPSDGRIVEWALNTAVAATAVTNAPTGCLGMTVQQDGFMLALGPGGLPRRIKWSGQGDDTVWTPSSTNQAGSVDLVSQGTLKRGVPIGPDVLVFTDLDVHVARYVGLPAVFAYTRIGSGCGLIGRRAVASMGNQAIWWSPSGFWRYDGSLSPIGCDVWQYLTENVNPGQRSKIHGWHNAKFGEVWFEYPSIGSTEIDSYVSYDYRNGHWNIGSLARTCAVQEGVFKYPIAVDSSGLVYEHEVGTAFDGATPFVETGPIQLGTGDQVLRVSGLVADDETVGQVTGELPDPRLP